MNLNKEDLFYHYINFLSHPNTIPSMEQNIYIYRVILGCERDILPPDYTGDFHHSCLLIPHTPYNRVYLGLGEKRWAPGARWQWRLTSPKPTFVGDASSSNLFEVCIYSPHNSNVWVGCGATPSLAMCVAALKAQHDNKHIYN
jgi:hypothetical protein